MHKPRPSLELPAWLSLTTGVIVLGCLLYAPLISAPYANTQRALVCVYAVVGLGLHLLTGMTGQISLGHGFFFALGAYVSAVLAGTAGWPYLLAIPVAAAVGWGVGFVFGLPALRLSPLSLSVVTLALALITPSLIKRFDDVTHGARGIALDIAAPPAWTGLDRDQWVFYICLAVTTLTGVMCRLLSRGRTGRAMRGLRDNEAVATTMGIRPSTTKSFVFATSTALAAVAGVLYTYVTQFVAADAFHLTLAIAFLTMVVVGGLGSLPGVILGAIFVVYMPSWTAEINESASGLMYGVALVAFMFLMPYGVAGLLRAVGGPLLQRREQRAGQQE
ncbi:hypothetical protein GCM10023259_050800 [Thermocatellispora tengchongensis]